MKRMNQITISGKNFITICLTISLLLIIVAVISFSAISKPLNISMETAENMSVEQLMAKKYQQLTDESVYSNLGELCEYVQFNAFFVSDVNGDGIAEKLNGTCRSVTETDDLHVEVKVLSKGYLKNAKINLYPANFIWTTQIVADTVVKENYLGATTEIKLKDEVPCGAQKLMYGGISPDIKNVNDYTRTSSVTLTGIYVDEQGNETNISKTVNLTVDWYGKVDTLISTKMAKINTQNIYKEENNEITIAFSLETEEVLEQLILKDNILKITVPEIFGFKAINATCINSNVESSYDNTTGLLTVKRSALVTDDGNVIDMLSNINWYTIEFYYEKEMYNSIKENSTSVEIPLTVTYTGYNNQDKYDFENPEESTKNGVIALILEHVDGKLYNYYVEIGERKENDEFIVLKNKVLDAYNNKLSINEKDYYEVRWKLYTGSLAKDESSVKKAIMKEQESNYEDKFLNISAEYMGIEEYTTNVGIYFKGADYSLNEDGTIKIYNDETNELIYTFTKDEWSKYTKEKPYMYEEGIKHVRVETSKVTPSSVLEVCHKKELNVDKIVSEISKEDFDNISYIYTYLTGSVLIGRDTASLDRIEKATYKGEESKIEVTAQPECITNQETSENYKIVIKTVKDEIDCAKWINGEFLVKLPEDIIYAEINDIAVNNSNITILGYDIYKEGNNYFIKIITENETEDIYEITIDADITPNPLGKKEYKYFQVYAYNANCNNYYKQEKDVYDVNKNSNIEENVGYDTTPIEIVPPTNLLTSESITNYDVEQNITVAPNIANVKKEQRTATINVYVKNEYTSTISDAIILGEIPYVGNEYIINKYNLNSEFTVEMQNSGLKVPEQLKNIVNVYYTENETATQDITLEDNGWTQTPSDWTKVRRYLIDFGTYKIPRNAEYTFMYDVKIPEGIEYDKVAYCNHAIFFCLDTIGGKLPTQTEPNRVGLRIARQYNLNITKYKKGTTQAVSGATYRLTEKKDEAIISTKMLTTNFNGELKLNDLSINKTYTLKEIKAPENYELNEDEIEFKVIENAENKLEVQVLSEAKFKNEPVIETSETAREILKVEIEDSPKYKVIITKKEKDTNVKLKNVKFQISETEKDGNEGKEVRTNNEGIITLDNLALNKEYTLKEVQAVGYYLPENDYKFKLAVNAEGEYEIVSNIPNTTLSNIEDIPTLNIELFNEKVPTYTLEILKVAVSDDNNTGLAGAKYQIKSTDTGNTETYITNNEGIIQINNLYEFVEGKSATAQYILQEEKAPYGYANNAEKYFLLQIKQMRVIILQYQIKNL